MLVTDHVHPWNTYTYLATLVGCELIVHIPAVVSHWDFLPIVAEHSDWLSRSSTAEGTALCGHVAEGSQSAELVLGSTLSTIGKWVWLLLQWTTKRIGDWKECMGRVLLVQTHLASSQTLGAMTILLAVGTRDHLQNLVRGKNVSKLSSSVSLCFYWPHPQMQVWRMWTSP